ncbi:hypothetical protein TNIN_162491, partial [Trichonephila inaurata madagascariensis]
MEIRSLLCLLVSAGAGKNPFFMGWVLKIKPPGKPQKKSVAGDCLNEKECHECAKKVVAYMQSIEAELERERQKKLKIAR